MATETHTPESVTFELVNRQPSQWIKKTDNVNGQIERLDRPNSRTIKTTSSVRVERTEPNGKKVFVLEPIRYIAGADTIWVKEQKERGIVPNRLNDLLDLQFDGPTKTVTRDGNIALFDYLMKYEGLEDNPDRPKTAKPVFKLLKTEEVAENNNDTFSVFLEASNYLNTLQKKETDKKTVYDERQLNFLVELFGLGYIESPSEKFTALIRRIQLNPATFLQTINEAKFAVVSHINQGLHLEVIAFDASRAMLLTTKDTMMKFTAKSREGQVDELAAFFLSKDGEKMYNKFSDELQKMIESKVAVQK